MKLILYLILVGVSCNIYCQHIDKNAYRYVLIDGFDLSTVAEDIHLKEVKKTTIVLHDRNIFDTLSISTVQYNKHGKPINFTIIESDSKSKSVTEYRGKKVTSESKYEFDIDSNAYLITSCLKYRYNLMGMKSKELEDSYSYYYYPTDLIEITKDSTIFFYKKSLLQFEISFRNNKLVSKINYSYNHKNMLEKLEYFDITKSIDSLVLHYVYNYVYDSNSLLVKKIEINVNPKLQDSIVSIYKYDERGFCIKKNRISAERGNSLVVVRFENNLPVEVSSINENSETKQIFFYNDKSLFYKIMVFEMNKLSNEELETIYTYEYSFY